MIAAMLSPWAAVGLGATTLGVYGWLHFRKLDEQDAAALALLTGSLLLLVLQSLEVV